MKKIGILYHPLNDSARTLADELREYLRLKGVSTWITSAWEEEKAKSMLDGTDFILSIGGDGTILRAAQIALAGGTPIAGINRGNLGFMTEFHAEDAKTGVDTLLEGKTWIDERAMLQAELLLAGEKPRTVHALNDVVMARGAISRLVSIDVTVNDEPLATYRADGIIIATATGSTGYSLAAGGPVLYPHSPDFVLTPVLPHLSPAHSLVLPANVKIKMSIRSTLPGTISIDGHINTPAEDSSVITIKRSPKTTRFLRTHPLTSFYTRLEEKLKGKQP